MNGRCRARVDRGLDVLGADAITYNLPGVASGLKLTPEVLAEQQELSRIWSGSKKTVLFITHDIDEAILLADRVLVVPRNEVREAPRGADRRVVGGMMLGIEPRQRSTVNGQRGRLWACSLFTVQCSRCTRRQ